jgi:hypothetical protein
LEVQAVHPGRPIRISREPGDLPDPWEPQITWRSGDGNSGSLHLPLWELKEELPVDLCFDVELRMEETGEVFEANPLVVIKGTKTSGYFFPESSRDFGGGKTGLIPVRIVLKPSRATALTDIRVTQYYQGTITSEPLRAKVMRD